MNTSFPCSLVNGDNAVSAVFGNRISGEINQRVRAFQLLLIARHIPGFIEAAPIYCTLMIHYDPCLLSHEELLQKLRTFAGGTDFTALPSSEILEAPVLRDGEMGPDFAHVTEHAGISETEVIKLHSGSEYLIYMFGFTPGFIYLGDLNPKFETPRLETPYILVPADSIGIAGKQTGIYPIVSLGGWQLIGRTPVRMYSPDHEVPILPRTSQYVHFPSATEEEYQKIEAEIGAGTYRLNIRK